MQSISGLFEISDVFDAVLIDQYGVLHDGTNIFPAALDCLQELKRRNIPVVALSNSGRRAKPNLDRLQRLGFPSTLFERIITSGELARAHLAAMLVEGKLAVGDNVLVLSRGSDTGVLDELGLKAVRQPDDSVRLVLIAGITPENVSREDYRALLFPLALRGIPALCANPDLKMYVGGTSSFGTGIVAMDYEQSGGDVTYLGKPDPEMFRAGLVALGNPAPSRCLMIGDSPKHDILGATRAGCKSLLVQSGVQAGDHVEGAVADYAILQLKP